MKRKPGDRWISVTDKLPPLDDYGWSELVELRVTVYSKGGRIIWKPNDCGSYCDDGNFWVCDRLKMCDDYEVTAWRPLRDDS